VKSILPNLRSTIDRLLHPEAYREYSIVIRCIDPLESVEHVVWHGMLNAWWEEA
jgi:hypothetical protein